MTYGISVKSSTNTLQIDSDQPYSYYKLIASGTGTTVTVSGLNLDKDLVLAKPASPANHGSLGTIFSPSTGKIDFKISANYYVLRPVAVTGASSATYGIRVYNVDGQIAFDSGHFGTGEDVILQIASLISPGAASGNTALSPQSIVYSGTDYASVYACVNKSNVVGTTNNLNDFFWSSPTKTIRFNSYLYVLGTYYYFTNPALILAKVAIP